MAKQERIYAEQLKALGVYNEAFDGAIHELCVLKRELRRARSELSKKHPKDKYKAFTDPLYSVIQRIETEVLAREDSLGLTPKGLLKLKGKLEAPPPAKPTETTLSIIQKKHEVRKSTPTA